MENSENSRKILIYTIWISESPINHQRAQWLTTFAFITDCPPTLQYNNLWCVFFVWYEIANLLFPVNIPMIRAMIWITAKRPLRLFICLVNGDMVDRPYLVVIRIRNRSHSSLDQFLFFFLFNSPAKCINIIVIIIHLQYRPSQLSWYEALSNRIFLSPILSYCDWHPRIQHLIRSRQ